MAAGGILTGANRKKWYVITVDKILRKEKYTGDEVLQKTYVVDFLEKNRAKNDRLIPQYYGEGSYEAIISTQIFMEVREELSAGHEAELNQIEEKLKDLQNKVVENVNNNDEFDSLVDEIEQFRSRKEELIQEQALNNRNTEYITALRDVIEAGRNEALVHSDKLVRDFIDRIEVFLDTIRITLKAGVTTSVRMYQKRPSRP